MLNEKKIIQIVISTILMKKIIEWKMSPDTEASLQTLEMKLQANTTVKSIKDPLRSLGVLGIYFHVYRPVGT